VKADGKQSFKGGFLLGLFFDLEDGYNMFLRNVGSLSTDYTALYPRRQSPPHIIFSIPLTVSFTIFDVFK
jgi:hypothetical protein